MPSNYHPIPGRLWIISLTEQLSQRADRLIKTWPPIHRNHLGDQWIRAIDSVGLNVSEGYARAHSGERKHFFSYASGSVEEVMYCVRRARDRGLMTRLDAWGYAQLLQRLGLSIQNLASAEKPRN